LFSFRFCPVHPKDVRDSQLRQLFEVPFNFARQLATSKQPSDIAELWTAHAKKQFETLTEQTKELTALGQKIAGESAEPIARSVNQAFKKAS
jgi:hypothetical protein